MVQAILGEKLFQRWLKFRLKEPLPQRDSPAFTLENVLIPTVGTDWGAQCLVHWDFDTEVNGRVLVNHQIESVHDAMFCGWAPSGREMAKDRMVDNPVFQ